MIVLWAKCTGYLNSNSTKASLEGGQVVHAVIYRRKIHNHGIFTLFEQTHNILARVVSLVLCIE